jgi:hypothetical protein
MNKERKVSGAAGIAEIRMKNPKRTGSLTVREYYDMETGELRELLDVNGKQIVLKYTRAVKKLDLSKEKELAEFNHLKDHPIYVKGPNPVLEIVDIVRQAEDEIQKKDIEAECNYIIRKLSGPELKSFARVLGINVGSNSEAIVKRMLYEKAEESPEEVLKEWEDPDRGIKQLLNDGKASGIFTVKNSVWYFKDAPIGSNFEQALLWLIENDDLHPSIRKELVA